MEQGQLTLVAANIVILHCQSNLCNCSFQPDPKTMSQWPFLAGSHNDDFNDVKGTYMRLKFFYNSISLVFCYDLDKANNSGFVPSCSCY